VQELIAAAYRVKDYQVSGPRWIKSARFDVLAKLPDEAVGLAEPAKGAQIWLMGQTLLAERFGLELHRETRTVAACELVVDKGGPKFHESGPDPGYNVTVRRGRAPDALSAGTGDAQGREDIRTVLREQLGLKLVSAKLPVEVLIVDRIGNPYEN
jgi:uncharacterized protein (TIGR03435 family)